MSKCEITGELVKYKPSDENEVDEKIINKRTVLDSLFKRVVALKKFWGDFKTIIAMIIDWRKGFYKEVSRKTIFLLSAALIYVLTPMDLINDWISIVGYVDDAVVIGFILKKCSHEIEKYREWKKFNIDISGK